MAEEVRLARDNSIKHWLKLGRWQIRRNFAAIRWGFKEISKMPAILGNAMPKSGSHLIIQVLQGLTKIGPFVNPGFPPVNRTEDNRNLSEGGVLANIHRMKPGDIRYGYLHASQAFIEALTQPGMATVFVYRDPRDMIVSHIFYATEMYPEHGMHNYYTEKLNKMEDRINAAIVGVNEHGSEIKGVKARYDEYLGWRETPGVLSMRFEDLILNRESAFNRLLFYLEEKGFTLNIGRQKAIEMIAAAIIPKKSGTFRQARPGNWREYFTQANIDQFKTSTGDLLIRLGYESDLNW